MAETIELNGTGVADLFFIGIPREVSKVKALLYGPSGTGKTRLASTFPSPVFLDFDGSASGVPTEIGRFPKDPARRLDSWEDFRKVIGILKGGKHPFETIVVDSMNEMLAVLSDHVVKTYSGSMKRNYSDVPSMSDYSKINLDFKRAVRAILALPYHVVFTCTIRDREKETDLVEPKLSGQLTKDIVKYFDMIGYMVIGKGGKGERTYNVSFEYGPEYTTKNRFDGFPPIIPSHWNEISSRIYTNQEK